VASESGTQDFDVTAEPASGAPETPKAAGPATPEIWAALEREPFCFNFFQAVRLLERLMPEREPVGLFVNPAREVVHFGAHQTVSFPPSQLYSLQRTENGPARMTLNFMGLTGASAVLPHYYTELVITRGRAKDHAIREFFDIFNHRMISLFFQAWQKYRFTIAYERGERDRFSHHLLDLIGLGTEGLQNRQSVADDSLIYYAGLLAQQPRSAVALRQVLEDYFDVPAEIEQFAGGWFQLDTETQCCFEDQLSSSEQLGLGAVVGDQIWDQQSSVRVKLGPLTLTQYLDFLPNGTAYRPLCGLLGFFAETEFDFEVQLVLKQDEVPSCELGADEGATPQLGWVTWMKSAPFPRNPGDTVLHIS
jgi:type VI secretion system protein ImpH